MPRIPVPAAHRDDDTVHGHWLLARLGKRVLRPGGLELTRSLLQRSGIPEAEVVELAPGMGRTATEIAALGPRSYRGVDADPDAAANTERAIAGIGTVTVADASETGLPSASADVVIGEAMLTMQGEKAKGAIVAEAARLLRPGGRYAIHELSLTPDSVGEDVKTDIRQSLARSIRVNARPLTTQEWRALLADHGLVVDHVETVPMALLDPKRIIADEGLTGALRFAVNLLRQRDARRRVLAMRATFRAHRAHLRGIAIIAHKPE
ncbi:class I SAM-dependent methyltransferase [Janibacter cremeus]|uniref:SAM-dependent methyltransferase n=1 Tax=Janibacter cremeus TaxID=1285192 RepID=A0A852VJ05_9MICO|nr:class I SAM-dependent methyltransferase [Janibacter cremeus]NYF97087.1 SAM-dependent methyltransferase [Janibacter cremeus]